MHDEIELLPGNGRALSVRRRVTWNGKVILMVGLCIAGTLALFRGRQSRDCDPFLAPGFLDVDEQDWKQTIWRPFDRSCRPSHLWPDLIAALRTNDHLALKQFDWLRGRTVLKIGDSVARNLVGDLCGALGLVVEQFVPGHPLAPEDWSGPYDRPRPADSHELWREARPRRCRIDALDFEIIMVFQCVGIPCGRTDAHSFGVATAQEFAAYDPALPSIEHHHHPVALEDRLEHVIRPLLHNIGRQPDLVEFNSNLWDSRFQMAADSVRESVPSPLWTTNRDRMAWYAERLGTAFDRIERAFPRTQLLWRRPHETTPYIFFPVQSERTHELASLADHLLATRPRWRIDNFGGVLGGHTTRYRDGLHPSVNQSAIWVDILLHELSRL